MDDKSNEPSIVVTVSGTIPVDLAAQVAAGLRPRADYVEMADRLGAALVDVPAALAATGRVGQLIHAAAGPGVLLAWYLHRNRHRYDLVLTDGEQVGLPLALLTRLFTRSTRARHVMIVHILSTRSKRWLIRTFRLTSHVDRYIVYCSRQFAAVEELGVDPLRIVQMPFMVDTAFFRRQSSIEDSPLSRPMICSAGLERRDYPTLMNAVEGLDLDVVIAAASPWSTQSDRSIGRELPPNVRVERYDLFDLRALYAASRLVVMPLQHVDFQAGITTILEAMSMERVVICTRTPGQIDTIVDGVTGVYVEHGDVEALRAAIDMLLQDDEFIARVGHAARQWAVANADIDIYAEAIASVVESARSDS